MIASLNCISCYTLLESATRIETLVKACVDKGYDAVALMDKNHLYGVHPFVKACQKYHIKPLIGLSLEYTSERDGQPYFISLIAKDNEGLRHLYHLSTIRNETKEAPLLERYASYFSSHLLYMTSGSESEIEQHVFSQNYDQAKAVMATLSNLIAEPIYFALPTYMTETQLEAWTMFQEWMAWPFIACNEVKRVHREEAFLQQVLTGIAEDKTLRQLDEKNPNELLQDATSFQQFYNGRFDDALKNMEQVASFEVTLRYHQALLPQYPVPNNINSHDYLVAQCQQGKERISHWNEAYEERLNRELTVIHQMGFDDYFLIVWDVMKEARRRHILTAPGRGSAAGSLVAYLLHITDIDPLPYHLLFERFLNENRKTMPDIDLDFPDYRRDEMYDYLAEKYGYDNVARIITFGTLAAKQVIRDVTRVFGLSKSEQLEWVRAVQIKQHDVKITLRQAYQDSYPLRSLVQRSEKNQKIFQTALALEGLPKNSGMHAAGVILMSRPLVDEVPLQKNDSPLWVTQWPMTETEEVGLLKMDFLGLKNLTIIDLALSFIKKTQGLSLDIETIPLDDKRCYDTFSQAATLGIFQFESRGMKRLLREIQPKTLEDLSLINAIHRPGPALSSEEIVARRFHKKPIQYIDPVIQPILKDTYGLMVYQEQVMQVAQVFAGYTLAEADNFRRAMSKKNREQMEAERQPFLEHAKAMERDMTVANALFEQMMAFAGYGFNKSHSIAYSILAYRMMYLKVYYPQAFYLALLKTSSPRATTFRDYIQEMNRQHCELLPPTIEESGVDYIMKNNAIRMGFSQIKGIDRRFAQDLVTTRQQYGTPKKFEDWLSLLPTEYHEERYLVPLIEAGVFDRMESNRRYLIENLEAFMTNATYAHDEKLKDVFQLVPEFVPPFSLNEQLQLEKDRIGAYLATQPLQKVEKMEMLLAPNGLAPTKNHHIRAIVIVNSTTEIKTKRQEKMLKLSVEDRKFRVMDAIIFPAQYRQFKMKEGELYLIEGRLQEGQYGVQLLIDYSVEVSQLRHDLQEKRLYLRVPTQLNMQNKVLRTLQQAPGHTPVVVVVEGTKQHRLLNEHYWITYSSQIITSLVQLLGEENVRYQ